MLILIEKLAPQEAGRVIRHPAYPLFTGAGVLGIWIAEQTFGALFGTLVCLVFRLLTCLLGL